MLVYINEYDRNAVARREKRTGYNKLKNSLQVIKEPLER